MKRLLCPRCKSTRIQSVSEAITGQYHCTNCMYYGSLVIEEDIPIRGKEKSR